ncbi:cytochrome P450 [Coniochaeta sp. 2T2.1]|nr:cytochrome P450 [Coniochaeta sp. 2T2.1]
MFPKVSNDDTSRFYTTSRTMVDPGVKILGICLCAWLVFNFIYNIFFHPLSRVPGPFIARFSRFWKFYSVYRVNFQETNLNVHKKYGPVVRIAPNDVSVWSAEAMMTVHGLGTEFTKGAWYNAVRIKDPNDPDSLLLLSELNEKKRRLQRRLYGPIYSTSGVTQHEQGLDRVLVDFIALIREKQVQKHDLEELFHSYICDALGELLFSTRPGYIRDGHDHGTSHHDWRKWRTFTVMGQSAMVTRVYQFLRKVTPIAYFLEFDHFVKFLMPAVRKNFPNGLQEKDGLDSLPHNLVKDMKLLTARKSEINPKWTPQMAALTALAGNGTTLSTALSFFANLSTRPDVQKRLVAEIQGANLSNPPKYSELVALPYLEACIKEAMRMYPAVTAPIPRVAPAGGVIIDGYEIPAGTNVDSNPYVVHRNPDIFDEDCEEYKPERWMAEDKEVRSVMQNNLLIWGGRSRMCAGKDLAKFILIKAIGAVLAAFDVEIEWDKERDMKEYTASFISFVPGERTRIG